MMANGKMESNMGKLNSQIQRGKVDMVFGKMENEKSGFCDEILKSKTKLLLKVVSDVWAKT